MEDSKLCLKIGEKKKTNIQARLVILIEIGFSFVQEFAIKLFVW